MTSAITVVLGLLIAVVGVFLIYVPAGVIAAGAALIAAGYLEAPHRETSRRPRR